MGQCFPFLLILKANEYLSPFHTSVCSCGLVFAIFLFIYECP